MLAAGDRGGGGGKGADDSGAIEASTREHEHTRRSRSSLERSEKPERGRMCPATRSSGGAEGVTDDSNLRSERESVSDGVREREPRGCSRRRELSWGSLKKERWWGWRWRPWLGKDPERGNLVATSPIWRRFLASGGARVTATGSWVLGDHRSGWEGGGGVYG